MSAMVDVGDRVVLRSRSAAFAALVRHVKRAARVSGYFIAVRPLHEVSTAGAVTPGEPVIVEDSFGRAWRGVVGGFADQAIGLVLRDDENDVSNRRMNLVWKAEIASKFHMFDEMVDICKDLAYFHMELSTHENYIIMSSFGGQVKACRDILKSLKKHGHGVDLSYMPNGIVRNFEQRISTRLQQRCQEAGSLIENHLLPFCSNPETLAFYHKMIGDLSWIASEHDSSNRHALIAKSQRAYEAGLRAIESLPGSASNSVLLGIALNLSTLVYFELGLPDRACSIAQEALNEASNVSLSSQSLLIVNLIKENVHSWLPNVRPAQGSSPDLVPDLVPQASLPHIQEVPEHPPLLDAAENSEDVHGQMPDEDAMLEQLVQEVAQNVPDLHGLLPQDQVHEYPPALNVGEIFEDLHGQVPNEVLEQMVQEVPQNIPDLHGHLPQDQEVVGHQQHAPQVEGAADAQPFPCTPKTVPIGPQLQLEFLYDLDDRPGNSRGGKKYRRERKDKAAEKGKYG